jgi:uncharacterized protein (TIGR02186 family)
MTYIRSLLICITLLLLVHPAQAKPLVADISSHYITLNSGFHGTQLMLFGARNDAGDVVVVVRGPDRKAVVRKKERVAGLWINRTSEKFSPIAGFYAIKTSRPFDEMMKSTYFDALGIGTQFAITPFVPTLNAATPAPDFSHNKAFKAALLGYLTSNALYSKQAGDVEFIEETLFKTTIDFPDSTPRGTYTAEVYLFSDGVLVGSYTAPIEVFKTGLDAYLFDAAHEHATLYGLCAVLLALLIGWMASEAFRRI